MSGKVTIRPFGERAYLVELGNRLDDDTSDRVRALHRLVQEARKTEPAIGASVPAYTSVLVPFDAETMPPDEVRCALEAMAADASEAPDRCEPELVEIEVRYGGDDGADLDEVSERTGLSPERVIEVHTRPTYRVHMLGFAPGFAYLGPLPESIRLPRRSEPRMRVPAGSVAIAAAQTAVYPFSTPGGWHLIGHTGATFWDGSAAEPSRLQPGDQVHFVAV